MRFTPVALLAAVALTTVSSGSFAQGAKTAHIIDARSAELVRQGQALQAQGNLQGAIGLYESALVIDPANDQAYRQLANTALAQGLSGKAIGYYGRVLAAYPADRQALAGQGKAMVLRGAMEKARENLTRLRAACGGACAEVTQLDAAIAAGPPAHVATDLIRARPVLGQTDGTAAPAGAPVQTTPVEPPKPKN